MRALFFASVGAKLLEGDPTKSRIYKDIGNSVATAGIEYYLPCFSKKQPPSSNYISSSAVVVLHGELEPVFQRFWQDTQERYRLVQGDPKATSPAA
jgi:transcription-repair coupling factor (superfamily II helicase)